MAQFGVSLPSPYDQRFLDAVSWRLTQTTLSTTPTVATAADANALIKQWVRDFIQSVERDKARAAIADPTPIP